MDIVVLIIAIVVYLLWQVLTSAGSQQKPRPTPRRQPDAERGPRVEGAPAQDKLQDALRDIREALGGPAERRPEPRPGRQQRPQQPASAPSRVTERYHARQEELRREQQEIEEETRRFEERRTATMDQQLERQRALAERAAAAERRTRQKTQISEQPLTVEKDVSSKEPARASRWAQRLYHRDAAREAIALSEVLGPPRSRTWQRRRRP